MPVTYQNALMAFNSAKRATFIMLNEGKLEQMIAESPNLHKMRYTYLHRQAIFNVAKSLNIDPTPYLLHDTEKYFMYLWMEENMTRGCHRLLNKHHYYNLGPALNKEILIEMMLDWESARFSKTDKPLNAYETLIKWMPHVIYEPMIEVLKEYGLDSEEHGPGITEEEYKEQSEAVTPAMIVDEIRKCANLHFEEVPYSGG